MNKYFIIATVLLVIGIATGSYTFGHSNGVDSQKIEDQIVFNQIEQERTKQKDDAAALLDKEIKKGIALTNQNQELIAQGVKDHEAFRKTTTDLNNKYSTLKLRFATTSTSTGIGSSSTTGQSGETISGTTSTSIVQLPDPITTNLRQLTNTADTYLGWYRKCYDYVEKVKIDKE